MPRYRFSAALCLLTGVLATLFLVSGLYLIAATQIFTLNVELKPLALLSGSSARQVKLHTQTAGRRRLVIYRQSRVTARSSRSKDARSWSREM
jgi:hypothetical protein